jgi:predicted dehydrogenase
MTATTMTLSRVDATLRALVRGGRIGGVTQVSFVDRRTPPSGAPASAHVPYAQLDDAAGPHFDSLCAILGAAPVSVVARATRAAWSPYDHGSTTEVIIEMTDGVRVQYHGSLTSNRSERAVWIDGASGVLWADLSRVWWRKRGWPVFVPILGRRGAAGATQADGRAWGRTLIDSAILSDRSGRVVHVDDIAAGANEASSPSPAREDVR